MPRSPIQCISFHKFHKFMSESKAQRRRGGGAGILLLAISLITLMSIALVIFATGEPALQKTPTDIRTPMGVLGDSDSHAYHDRILLPGAKRRGGSFRPTTLQWTEVVEMLRTDQIDQGTWGRWGTPYHKMAVLRSLVGQEGRAPQKEDFRYNFSVSGSECSALTERPSIQAQRLLYLMRQDIERWSRGVVVIRIGINSIGKDEDLDRYASTGLDVAARARLKDCIAYFSSAKALIRAEHPRTAILLASNADDNPPLQQDRWPDEQSRARISTVFDEFDFQLRQLCESDARCVYHSDRRWFRELFGAEDVQGHRAYRSIAFGGEVQVTNTVGDHPRNATTQDEHPGTALNALYAQRLLQLLNAELGFHFRAITQLELARVVDPDARFGLRAEKP